MGCIVPILRAGAGLLLSVVLFVGFGLSLVGSNVSDKLLNAEFYGDIIAAESTYNRIYDEVLVDDELKETVTGLLGNINVVSKQETVILLRQVVPPEYLVFGGFFRTSIVFFESMLACRRQYVLRIIISAKRKH